MTYRHPQPGGTRAEPNRLFDLAIRTTRLPRLPVALAAAAATLVVGVFDWWSGPLIQAALFYHLVIMTIAWMGRSIDAAAVAVLASVVELSVWALQGEDSRLGVFPVAWTLFTELFVLLALIGAIAAFRRAVLLLRRRTMVDPLTGVLNATAFSEFLERERSRALRENHPVTVAFLDLDDFKQVNDRLGHAAGDTVLRDVAAALRHAIRPYDAVGRLGGDEFAIVLPHTDERTAAAVADRIRRSVRHARHDVGLSAGVATYYTMPATVVEMVRAADTLMYEAKRTGKRRVVGRVVLPRLEGRTSVVLPGSTPRTPAHTRS